MLTIKQEAEEDRRPERPPDTRTYTVNVTRPDEDMDVCPDLQFKIEDDGPDMLIDFCETVDPHGSQDYLLAEESSPLEEDWQLSIVKCETVETRAEGGDGMLELTVDPLQYGTEADQQESDSDSCPETRRNSVADPGKIHQQR